MMRLTPLLALPLAAAAAGCGSQVDSDYNGEVITSIHGAVTGEASASEKQLEVNVDWFWYSRHDETEYGESQIVEVTAEFPYGFRLDFFTPPAELHEIDGARMALAEMFILDGPYPSPEVGGFVPFYAMAADHVLIYLEEDVVPGSIAAQFLNGELSAGFHVMEARQRADCSTANNRWDCEVYGQDDLFLAPDDLDTIIPLLRVDVTQGVGGILPYPWATLDDLQYPDDEGWDPENPDWDDDPDDQG